MNRPWTGRPVPNALILGEYLEARRLLTIFYVDTNNPAASDSNAGTSITSPLKTINQALTLAGANNSTSQTDTIYIRAGVYHEMPSVTTADSGASATSRTVLSAYPNSASNTYEGVYIDAADPTTGTWIQDGSSNRWYLPNFTTQTAGVWVDWSPSSNGASLQQIGYYSSSETSTSRKVVGSGLSDMYAGTYWGDTADSRLYVWLADGSNPNNHTLEYANRSRTIYQPGTPVSGGGYSYAQYFDFENLNLLHANVYNQTGQDPGCGIYTENDQRLINCTVQWNTRDGVHLQGVSQLINCTASNNGGNGVAAKGSGWNISGGHYNYNFWRNYNDGSKAGIKAITNNATPSGNIENVEAAYNYGKGIWYDTDYANSVVSQITGNYVHDNQDAGINIEASENYLIANNVITGNALGGIVLNAAENTTIVNNTLVGNYGNAAIELDAGTRTEEYNSPTQIGMINNTVEGNIIANNFTAYDLDIPTSAVSSEIYNNTSDYNLFYRRGGPLHFTTGGTYVGWAQTPSLLSAWRSDSGQDAHSIVKDPMFVAGGSGSNTYVIGSSSPAITAALVQSSLFTTDFAGNARPTTGGYDMGAFQHSTTNTGTAGPVYTPVASIWMDDQMPPNAAETAPDSSGNTGENQFWIWNSSNTYSGFASLDSTAISGAHREYFTGANARAINSGDTLFAYIWIDPTNVPSEAMFEWQDSSGSWNHDAYWGQNLLTTPVSGSGFTPVNIGALPAAGAWALLSLPASSVGLVGKSVTGFSFDLYNGRALLDEMGTGTVPTVAALPSIAGKVFLDTNDNGTLDSGEAGLPGRTVYLDLNRNGQLDAGEPTTVTDASGNYAFYNLANGTYSPEQLVPSGYVSTQSPPLVISINVSSGVTATQNFGEMTAPVVPSIAGTVFLDANDNGTLDSGETGLSGRTVFLDLNRDGQLDPGDPTTTTDSSGNYAFYNLANGTYSPEQVVPSGYTSTQPPPVIISVNVSSGVTATQNFGEMVSVVNVPSIAGTVFLDANDNGTLDSGETGLAGRTVFLDLNLDGQLDPGDPTTTTDSSGNYAFYNLANGTYSPEQVVPGGYTSTQPTPVIISVTVTAGVTATQNFGEMVSAVNSSSISGTVFLDANANGSLDNGEVGLANQTVFVDLNGDNQLDPGDPTAVTDASGHYAFYNLTGGTYTVEQIVPSGFVSTPLGGSVSPLNVTTGTTVVQNFGLFPTTLSSIGNGNNFILALSPDQSLLEIWQGTSETSPPTYTLPNYTFVPLSFSANGFASSLTVDETNGSPFYYNSITFDGGSAQGTLIIQGNPNYGSQFYIETGYIIAGGAISFTNVGAISIIGGSGDDTLYVDSTAVPVSFAGGNGNDYLYVDSGNYVFNSDPGLTTSNLNVGVAYGASITFAGATSGNSINTYNLATLSLSSNSLATMAASNSSADRSLLILRSLTFDESTGAPNGVLDIGNGDAIIRGGDPNLITAALAEGYNQGNWNGANGIVSTAAANDPLHITAVGMGTASSNTFDGQSIVSSDVVLKYTYYGDAALTGSVSVADTTLLDFGYLVQATGWYSGDFNYDGVINGSDYTLFDNAFNTQGASFAAQIAAQIAPPTAAPNIVPTNDSQPNPNRSGQSLATILKSAAYLMSDPALPGGSNVA